MVIIFDCRDERCITFNVPGFVVRAELCECWVLGVGCWLLDHLDKSINFPLEDAQIFNNFIKLLLCHELIGTSKQ